MSSPSDPTDSKTRAQAIVEDTIARRRAGEVISDEEVLQQYPELLGTLEGLLRRAAMLDRLRPGKHPLEDLLNRLDVDPELGQAAEAADEDAPELADQLLPLQTLDQNGVSGAHASAATTDAEPPLDVGVETHRITFEEGSSNEDVASSDLDPQPPLSVIGPEGDGAQQVAANTWNEPSAVADADELTAKLYQSPGFGEAERYRPTARPPMAILRVLDDNQLGGELFRLRHAETTLGREAADICMPHDAMISSVHARIERLSDEGGWKWQLTDLGSTNGVFVKARKIRLRDGDQLIIGNRVVQFTQAVETQPARLDEIRNQGVGQWLQLTGNECWIGRDQSVCESFLADEPMVDQRFARLLRRPDGRWTLWSNQSVNGLWIRVSQIKLVGGSMFQLGEQRFSFHTP